MIINVIIKMRMARVGLMFFNIGGVVMVEIFRVGVFAGVDVSAWW